MLYRIFWLFFSLSLMGSVLACMILLVKTFFKTRFSAKWHYYVWALLLIRLVIPFAPEHAFSIFNLFKPVVEWVSPQYSAPINSADMIPIPTVMAPILPSDPASGQENVVETNAPDTLGIHFSVEDIIGILWIIGILVMVFAVIGANVRFSLRHRKMFQFKDAGALSLLDECRRELGVKKQVPILLDPKTGTPLLFGLLRPRILASKDMLQRLSDEEKRYIFLHELMHFKRKDIFINWITAIIKCIYWFNPVLWYACLRIKEDCEFSCDESVLGILDPMEYKRYGQTILNLVNIGVKPFTMTCTTGIAGRKSSIKRRIYMIAGFKKKTLTWTLTAVALTLLVGCSALTGARTDASPLPEQSGNGQETVNNGESGTTDDQANQDNEETTSPAPAATDETAGPTPATGGGASDPILKDGLAIVIMSPNQPDNVNDIVDELKNGRAVIYDSQGNITAFGTSDIQLIGQLHEDGISNITSVFLQKVKDTNGTVYFSYISNAGVRNDKLEQLVDRAVRYYIDKLNDKTYTGTYGEGFTWYTAAEELGKIGKPAIPYLIDKLSTTDDYERSLTLYALLLATQQENVKAFAGNEYINVNLDFDASHHPDMVKTAMDWWEKYKSNF